MLFFFILVCLIDKTWADSTSGIRDQLLIIGGGEWWARNGSVGGGKWWVRKGKGGIHFSLNGGLLDVFCVQHVETIQQKIDYY